MPKKIKIYFEANQEHQARAVDSIVNLFSGLPRNDDSFQIGDNIVANLADGEILNEKWLYENLSDLQEQFNFYSESIGSSTRIHNTFLSLQSNEGYLLEGTGQNLESHRYPTFTVDMETGTGKTYVYFRTIHELRSKYGFRKFIIVVPSIAIYEGVLKSFQITREHFKTLYGNETVGVTQYDGQQIRSVRNFANSSFTEIMIITLDSFNKNTNLFYKATEKVPGEKKPFEYIQETRPILILDESQNYRSSISRTALRTLKPLFAINYSATPGTKPEDSPNLVYKLGPVDALRLNLVKKIQVWGVTEDYNVNDPQLSLSLEGITHSSGTLAARFRTLINDRGKMAESKIELKRGDDLFAKTKNIQHKGLRIESIDKKNGVVLFENGQELVLKEDAVNISVAKQEIFRQQINRTIQEHFSRQNFLRKEGVKVLSLFFIDRVANYVSEEGIIRRIFDEEFEKLKAQDPFFKKFTPEEVREGYFAKRKTKKDDEFVDTAVEDEKKTKEQKELEKVAYELIMKDKEKLLSFDEKVCFIFAHSALREGWDNPNVFQICTLNTAHSDNRKRQEIGRGLRLCVNQEGRRITDDGVNVLTVIPNESYRSYADSLQKEYAENGDLDYPPPSNATRTSTRRNEKVFKNKEFREFWKNLCRKTSYTIKVDTEQLVSDCLARFNNHQFQFPEPRIVITKGQFIVSTYEIHLVSVSTGMTKIRLLISDTNGNRSDYTSPIWLKKGAMLSLLANGDENLKPYKIVGISRIGEEPEVKFGNGAVLNLEQPIRFDMRRNVETDPRLLQEQQTTYPVFNIIDRASKEIGLTRPTLLRIFKGIENAKKEVVFKNPEGFSAVFISTIRELLSDHIADNIEYHLTDEFENYDLEEIFPDHRKFPQKELIDGSAHSLYDQVQVDSEVETRFIRFRVQDEDTKGNIVCYFKFPNTFKVNIPRIIGNYNPDWGIIRLDEQGRPTLHLVRETKGNTDTSKLRFSNEGRKIECAEKHFKAIGIDYRTVDDKIERWWLPKNY